MDRARTFQLSGFVDNYLRLNPVEEQQFQIEYDKIKLPQEREKIMEITTSWMEQGQELATRSLVIKLLTRKLGSLSPELLAQVNELNIDRLEVLAEDLLDFKQVGDLERWLVV